MAKNILIVDDEPTLVKGLRFNLEQQEGYAIDVAYDGEEALQVFDSEKHDLILLDLMLPKMDGMEVCQKIRSVSDVPIIMLTAKGEDMDKIMGLTIGADDYITKPFNPMELVARVKTQLRRSTRYNPSAGGAEPVREREIDIRGLVINQDRHKCTLYGRPVNLTPMEFGILWYLCEHQGRVVPSEELFEAVWGEKFLDNNNTVMAHIGRLREKLRDSSRNPKFIKTVWGVGYQIE